MAFSDPSIHRVRSIEIEGVFDGNSALPSPALTLKFNQESYATAEIDVHFSRHVDPRVLHVLAKAFELAFFPDTLDALEAAINSANAKVEEEA